MKSLLMEFLLLLVFWKKTVQILQQKFLKFVLKMSGTIMKLNILQECLILYYRQIYLHIQIKILFQKHSEQNDLYL